MAVPRRFDSADDRAVADAVRRLPVLAPPEMEERLVALGYRGQEEARRALCLLAYRHVRRLKRIHLEGVPRRDLPPKANLLLLGPTGCGKTFLLESLFREILNLPTVIVDVTGFSETGYVGRDPITILTSLIHAAGGHVARASVGLVALDEFDKLASGANTARFDGQGTTKDVSGYGVQKELLKQLTASTVEVPLDYNATYASRYVRMSTQDIPYVACGAFSGFKGLGKALYGASDIGFREPGTAARDDEIAYDLGEVEVNDLNSYLTYGFIPELIARFTRAVALRPLDRATLKAILRENVLPRFEREFRAESLLLKVEDAVLDHVVGGALERRTGARGLDAQLTRLLEQGAFDTFGRAAGEVRVVLEGGAPRIVRDVVDREPSRDLVIDVEPADEDEEAPEFED